MSLLLNEKTVGENIAEISNDVGDNVAEISNGVGENVAEILQGGEKKRKSTKRKRKGKGTKIKGRKGTKSTKSTKSRKGKGPSKWILHVKAFCRKTGKNFPQALKDPLCGKTFKH